MGCGASQIYYEFDKPSPEQVVPVQALKKSEAIIELTDFYNGVSADSNYLFVLVNSGSKYKIGKLDMLSGSISDLKDVQNYNEEKSIYWDKLKITDEGGNVFQICLSLTMIGGTTEDYRFVAEKKFLGNDTHKVIVSYRYTEEHSESSYSSRTAWQYKTGQQFVNGDIVEDINDFSGSYQSFNLEDNVKKSRYYPVTENLYIGMQPRDAEATNEVTFFNYDLSTKKSWGARTFFNKDLYVDGGVIKNGTLLCIITGRTGNYSINIYPTKTFLNQIKMLRASQD